MLAFKSLYVGQFTEFINPGDKTKYLPCNAPHRHSTTVSLETYLLYLVIKPVKDHQEEEVDSLRGALQKF